MGKMKAITGDTTQTKMVVEYKKVNKKKKKKKN
jgi:hypothetical protein